MTHYTLASRATRERNWARRPEVAERCLLCWAPVDPATARQVFVDSDAQVVLDDPAATGPAVGLVYIGPECAKRLAPKPTSGIHPIGPKCSGYCTRQETP